VCVGCGGWVGVCVWVCVCKHVHSVPCGCDMDLGVIIMFDQCIDNYCAGSVQVQASPIMSQHMPRVAPPNRSFLF
jgi:hypothetical protein